MSKKISTFKNTRISSILCNVKLWYSEKAENNWPIFHFLLDATMYLTLKTRRGWTKFLEPSRNIQTLFQKKSCTYIFRWKKRAIQRCVKFAASLFCSQFKVAKKASYDCLIIFTVFKKREACLLLFSIGIFCVFCWPIMGNRNRFPAFKCLEIVKGGLHVF